MRIILAQLTKFPEAGRVDIFEFSIALAHLGHDVHTIVCENVAESLPENLAMHELHISTNAGPANSLLFARLAVKKIRQIAKEQPVDIVHLFNPAPATYALGWLLKFTPGHPKIIYDVRTGGIGHRFDARLIDFMAKTAPWFADGIITLSSSLFTRLLGHTRIPHAVVPLGVATDRYEQSTSSKRGLFTFIYIGSLGKNRELTQMIEAFATVHHSHPDTRLVLAGSGDDLVTLKNLVKQRGLKDSVAFLGSIPFEQIPSLIATADCGLSYVPITPWFNPQPPLKTLEYLASGLLVVATATDSHKELWKTLPAELLTKDTPTDFSEGMEYAILHKTDLEKTDFRASALPYDWETITKNSLLPFYKKISKR